MDATSELPSAPFEKRIAGSTLENNINAIKSVGAYALVENYVSQVRNKDYDGLSRKVGLSESEPNYTFFHGTVPEKIIGIKQEGLKAFVEITEPRITVTPSPTVALFHTIANGPHDTLRKQGKVVESYSQDKPVLIVIKMPKDYLRSQDEGRIPQFDEDVARKMNVLPGENTKTAHFEHMLGEQARNWKFGKDTPTTGLLFPLKHIPTDYLYVRTNDGDVPIGLFENP